MNIGAVIERLRIDNRMLQSELAKKAGIDTNTVRSITRNRYNARVWSLIKIAKVFNMTLSELIKQAEETAELDAPYKRVSKRGRTPIVFDIDAAAKDYLSGGTLLSVAHDYGISPATLHTRLAERGISKPKETPGYTPPKVMY